MWRSLTMAAFAVVVASAATRRVPADYATIGACASGASSGDVCLVSPGTYSERVQTAKDNVSFQADGAGVIVTRGFYIRHANVTVDGFEILGEYTSASSGMISVGVNADRFVIVNNYLHNTTQACSGPAYCSLRGINFERTGTDSANYGIIRNNHITDVTAPFFYVHGTGHLIEGNLLERGRQWDFVYGLGTNNIYRRNVFGEMGATTGGNHPDYMQTFSTDYSGEPAQSNLFIENWISNLPSQFCQMNSSVAGVGWLVNNVKNWVLIRNVLANFPDNCNWDIPGGIWKNNTIFRPSLNGTGVILGGSLSRGDAPYVTMRSNAMVSGGSLSSNGFYSIDGFLFTREAIALFVTGESASDCPTTCPVADGITTGFITAGYIDGATNGHISATARELATAADMSLSPTYEAYRQKLWDALQESIRRDDLIKSTIQVDHNYVSGSPVSGYSAKIASGCDCGKPYTAGNFCEAACSLGGINGGVDPKFAAGNTALTKGVLAWQGFKDGSWTASTKSLRRTDAFLNYTVDASDQVHLYAASPCPTGPGGVTYNGIYSVASRVSKDEIILGTLLDGLGVPVDCAAKAIAFGYTPTATLRGADNTQLTTDDGLKPAVDSPLCGAGDYGQDIGAYSCTGGTVFSRGEWVDVSGGDFFTVARKSDGTLWSWGHNDYGNLGWGTKTGETPNPVPRQIGSVTTWDKTSGLWWHTLAHRSDGTLWAWGGNGSGQIGNGTSGGTGIATPTQVGTDTDWTTKISAGQYHSCAIKSTGTMWCWGANDRGQLGLGDNTNRSSPAQVGTDTDWAAITCGSFHTVAVKTDGSVWTWGANSMYGTPQYQLGDGTTTDRNYPAQIEASGFSEVSAGFIHTVALKTDGTVWAWGGNHMGELCNGNWISQSARLQIGAAQTTGYTWVSIAAKNDTTHMVRSDGTLWGCGDNTYGQVGDGTTTARFGIVRVGTDNTWTKTARTYYAGLGIKADGTLWTWGRNQYGQLGNNTTTDIPDPWLATSETQAPMDPTLAADYVTYTLTSIPAGSANPANRSFYGFVTGGTGTISSSESSPWCAITPASGTTRQQFTVSFDITGLSAGTYTCPVTLTSTGTRNSPVTITYGLTLTGTPTAPVVTTATLAAGTVGTAYPSTTLAASGSTPITWDIAAGALPSGLNLSSGGTITGTPTMAGTASFTARATNSAGSDTQDLTLTINGGGTTVGTTSTGGRQVGSRR